MGIPDDANISHFTSQSPYANLMPAICLVVASFEAGSSLDEQVLLPALRFVLEQAPYFWQVVWSHDKYHHDNPQHNITDWMQKAQMYIIDVSERCPDTFIELGRICEYQKQRAANAPIIVLENSEHDAKSKMSSRDGVIQINYTAYAGNHAIEDLAAEFKKAIEGRKSIRDVNTNKSSHYLSPLVLMDIASVKEETAYTLAKEYRTMENFIQVSPSRIVRQIKGLNVNIAEGYQQAVSDLLNDI